MSYERFLAPLILKEEERKKNELARRLARYDEAVRLLRELWSEAESEIPLCEHKYSNAIYVGRRVEAFLATEPAERGEGSVG